VPLAIRIVSKVPCDPENGSEGRQENVHLWYFPASIKRTVACDDFLFVHTLVFGPKLVEKGKFFRIFSLFSAFSICTESTC
jgi:hypothetical protein